MTDKQHVIKLTVELDTTDKERGKEVAAFLLTLAEEALRLQDLQYTLQLNEGGYDD